MARKALERVSQTEYARRLNVSKEAVSKAVRTGKIVKGWDKKQQKIIVDKANEEWGALHGGTGSTPVTDSKADISKAIEKILKEDAEGSVSVEAIIAKAEKLQYVDAETNIKRWTSVIKELEARKEAGLLVQKDIVYRELFAYGQSVRVAIMAVADRAIDNIRAAKNRPEAHNILTAALHEALEDITKSKEFDFKPRE